MASCRSIRSRRYRRSPRSGRSASAGRQSLQRVTRDTADRPLVLELGADRFVEIDRGRIPVQHRPFEARPALADAAARKMRHQGLADAFVTEGRAHEDIFQIDAVTSGEGGVVEK